MPAIQWPATAGDVRTSAFPQLVKANGTNIPVGGYAFDAATEEDLWFSFTAYGYTSGDVSVDLRWYADTASSGDVVWGAALSAITPNADTTDVETDALATAATATDTHLGTTGQRLHEVTVTITSLESLAANDDVRLRVYRDADAGGDTMAGDAILTRVVVRYSE